MSGFHFIVQMSNFLLINTTAMTLGQSHSKVIQYISPDLYILCPKYLRFSSDSFDVRGQSRGGCGKELRTKIEPRPGWLDNMFQVHILKYMNYNYFIGFLYVDFWYVENCLHCC